MKKYKLINTKTKEEHLCNKITIGGFDYYVSDEEIKVGDWYTWDGNKNNAPSLCTDTYNESSILDSQGFTKFYKVVATTNPNIDIPQILEEPNETLIHQIAADLGYRMLPDDLEEGIKAGYKESQETHPFNEDDVEFFVKKALEDAKKSVCWSDEYYKHLTKELLQLWKEQQHKIVYYE